MAADALIRMVARHLGSYFELGAAAAAEFRRALARRALCVFMGMAASIVGLLALWGSGLISVWESTWRLPYAVVSAVLLLAVGVWLLRSAMARTHSGPSTGVLRSELQKDMELFQQWKSTL